VNIKTFGPVDQQSLEQLERCMAAGDAEFGVLCADHHPGYSQPIGGGIAYEGHISPSGVGYDIGCIAGGVRVTTIDGWSREIQEVRSDDPVACVDVGHFRMVKPHFGSLKRGRRRVRTLQLANERALSMTADHRVMTLRGWVLDAPAWVRALFLSAFASAEMTTPRLTGGCLANAAVKQADSAAAAFVADLLTSLGFRCSIARSAQHHLVQVIGGEDEQLRFLEQRSRSGARRQRVPASLGNVAICSLDARARAQKRLRFTLEASLIGQSSIRWQGPTVSREASSITPSTRSVPSAVVSERASIRRTWARRHGSAWRT
jgi:tRNA-splicing ligase RtcB